ncbi:MAG: calcium-binding protein [Rhodospirillales bacterium]|nr:calcium-binding protein [Rhodospirillales bacterium]
MANVVSGSQALRLGALNVGAEFNTPSVYTSGTGAYFLLPTAYTALSGSGFSPQGPGEVPTDGTIAGWAKYSYDGTSHYTFSGLPNVPVATWTDAVEDNDATGLLTAALSGDDDITGGALADELWGFNGDDDLDGAGGNDTLRGDAGNDDLDGGAGADAMAGGADDDTYVVDNVGDRVAEAPSEGDADTVESSIAYTLGANVENLELTGTAAINGAGNGDANALTGNVAANVLAGGAGADTLVGNEGNDTLNGGAGVDAMTGGAGNDTYVVDNDFDSVTEDDEPTSGTDAVLSSVTHTLADNVETLTLTGTGAINATGNGLLNRLTGNAAANTLDGKAGADTMAGGAGNDVYVVDDEDDTVTEAANAGTDTVQSAVEFRLGANVENLTLTGSAAINGTGNTLANILVGNTGQNTLNGGAGADRMFGGGGDDTYFIDSTGDRAVEIPGGGQDVVMSSVSQVLGEDIEDLTLTGTSAINGTGNTSANTLTGNPAANTLAGGNGDDTLNGIAGNDTLRGDAGNDTLDGGLGADAMAGGADNDTYHVDNVGDRVTEGEGAGSGTDSVTSTIAYTLGANLENLTLSGTAANGTGNTADNTLTGNSGANVLNGLAGVDTMAGGDGNDTYRVDDALDAVSEETDEGTDTVESAVTYTIVDADVENLTLTGNQNIDGTGNASTNVLTGNSGANILNGLAGIDTMTGGDGNDTLDGGADADAMAGGAGNDTYVVDMLGETVTEVAGEGTADTVQSSVNHILAANVENLTLTGAAEIDGTGNGLNNTIVGNPMANVLTGGAGVDTLSGGAGHDQLDGGAGGDTMSGGADNDIYVVDDIGDTVSEDANAGDDSVTSSVDYILGDNVEHLTLTGTAANGTGNGLSNMITGNAEANALSGGGGADSLDGGLEDDVLSGGADNDGIIGGDGDDTINGGAGDDVMEGGAGADTFLFALGFGEDTISGWEAGDKISLDANLAAADFDYLDSNASLALDDLDDPVAVSGGNTTITFDGGDVLTVDAVDLDTNDFLFA